MFKKTCCSICLSINRRTINIYKTDLQYAYETLANFKIRWDECWMCYICHTRLRQCHQLQQLAVQTRGLIDDIFKNKIKIFGASESILELSTSQTNITSTGGCPCSYIKQESEEETGAYNINGIEQDEILENTNDYNKVKKEPSIETEDALVGIKQELSNVDNIDAQQKAKVPKLIIVQLSQSVIDKCIRQSLTTHPVTEIYPEDRGEKIFVEQSTEHPEIKLEIENKGIEQDDEQDNTNDCEGRDHAGEAQSGCYRGPLSCDVCLKNFACKSKLIEHMRTHTGEKPFSCDTCSKKFSRSNSLKKHQIIHTTEKPFSCDICLKKFAYKNNLINHILTHTDNKPFSCDNCLKKFTYKHDLKNHMLIHTGEQPFSCDICSKKFTKTSNFKQHKLVHTGEKPFSCDICLKSFRQKSNFKRHILIHTGRTPFSCDICLKKFTYKQDLKNHILIHTGEQPFSCDICSKKFTKTSNFEQHKLVHTGEKPFSCDICSKKFTTKSYIKKHKGIHTGEKLFSCEICLKKFTQRSQLSTHIMLIHIDK